jgi:circadian clock protein KaiB
LELRRSKAVPHDQPDDAHTIDKAAEFEQLLEDQQHRQVVLRLYVTGLTPRSTQAIHTIKNICEEELKGRYELEVIDLAKQPELAKEEDIIAAPTLIKQLPLPLRRLIGDLSNKERVLLGLDLRPRS